MRLFFLLMFALTSLGCVAVKNAHEKYLACAGDLKCYEEMSKIKENAYVATKTVSQAVASSASMSFPSIPEALAVLVSGLVSYVYGVRHGKKKG